MRDQPPASYADGFQLVQRLVVEDLKRTQIVQYAGASGDFNPGHTDEIYAVHVAGPPSVFGHGMLTMALTGKLLTDCRRHQTAGSLRGAFPGSGLARRRHRAGVAHVQPARHGRLLGDRYRSPRISRDSRSPTASAHSAVRSSMTRSGSAGRLGGSKMKTS
jgi:acyl dehydratase